MSRILVLEDSSFDRKILTDALRGQNLGEVIVPTNWKEGRALLLALQPGDVAVSDGYMGGDEWGESITARDTSALCPEGVHFVIHTGNPDHFADLGRHIIAKPNPVAVAHYIHQHLARTAGS